MNRAQEEMRTADSGDERLDRRVAEVSGQLGAHPQQSIPTACGGRAETMGAYRFFDNDKATFESVLAPHRDATVERMAACPVLLLVQDTTECDEWVNLGPKGSGTLKERRGKGVDEKESGRWIESYEASCALQGRLPETLIVNLADAEGDLYEWFADGEEFHPDTRAQWIVRAAQDRRVKTIRHRERLLPCVARSTWSLPGACCTP